MAVTMFKLSAGGKGIESADGSGFVLSLNDIEGFHETPEGTVVADLYDLYGHPPMVERYEELVRQLRLAGRRAAVGKDHHGFAVVTLLSQ